jgi:biopolymer transport protein ExbB
MLNLNIEITEYLRTGGLVMLPLGICSILMWGLIIYQLIKIIQFRKELSFLEKSNQTCSGWPSWVEDVFFRLKREYPGIDNELIGRLCSPHDFERNNKTILVLAAVAPLLGLLGTVTGMITTFEVISDSGTGDARGLATGIAEALVTTQTGLIIAIPGLFMGNFIKRRVEREKENLRRLLDNMVKISFGEEIL